MALPDGIVLQVARTRDQCLVVVAGVIKQALGISEVVNHGLG